jgi:hypothetical protein
LYTQRSKSKSSVILWDVIAKVLAVRVAAIEELSKFVGRLGEER